MYILASEKEAVRAELESVKTQLRAKREKASVQEKKIEELLSSLANFAKDLEVARSEVVAANDKAQDNATQYLVDVEATLAQAKGLVDHARWKALWEALEGACDQNFDISVGLEISRAEETTARKLAFPVEDSANLSEFGSGEDSEGEDALSNKDHAT